ncbi:acetyltransferase [Exiguobacterium sp. CH10]|uniref:acetyltransferase n=1 Tax=Exiguobacterium sp. CH10 TaxID=2751261 RepID=UPI001BE9CDBD|nr:acetyltransferase [Exiguobacterium sp. CH10]
MDKLLIIGASGHGKVIASMANDSGAWRSISFLDDAKVGETVLGFPVIDSTTNAYLYADDFKFIVGIGDVQIREKITLSLLDIQACMATIIHPSASIGLDVKIGEGTVIMPRVVINPSVTIGKGCILNTSSSVDHDCVIEDFVHLSPGVILGGSVKVKRNTWMGVGAKVINNINITNNCIVGAGSVVIDNLKSSGVYVGVPSKLKSERECYEKNMVN